MRATGIIKDIPTLETERLLLRRMGPDDAEAIFAYASDPKVTRYMLWETHHSIEDSRVFLERALERCAGGELIWGLVHREDDVFVGTCGMDLSPEHERAALGYVLARSYWGRGLMPEAARAMIRFAFVTLGLNRVEARCMAKNLASERVMQKAGMAYEGTLRRQEFVKGEFRDIKVYSILRSEYRATG